VSAATSGRREGPSPAPTLALQVHRGAPPPDWDAWARALGGGPFHCAGWAAYRASAAHKQAVFFAWHQPGSVAPVAVATAIETVLPGPLPVRSIHFDGPPASRLAPWQLTPDIRRWMIDERGMADAWLGSFDSRGGWADESQPPTRIEVHVEAAPEDQLLGNMRKLARRSIRKAGRAGVEVESDSQRISEFVGLYGATLDRLHRVKGVPTTIRDAGELTQGLAALRASGSARLWLASASGSPVAGCLFTTFGRRAFYLLGGANDAGRDTGATAAILHLVLTELSAQGFERISLGGVSPTAHLPEDPDHGLYAFKLGMGGGAHPCVDGRILVRPGRRRVIEAARLGRAALLARRGSRSTTSRQDPE
jgi:hypothetical protein